VVLAALKTAAAAAAAAALVHGAAEPVPGPHWFSPVRNIYMISYAQAS
jgi:hypothetical protein